MESYIFLSFIFFLFGALFGKKITVHHWSYNATQPYRILYKSKFYKVIDVEDRYSWENALAFKSCCDSPGREKCKQCQDIE